MPPTYNHHWHMHNHVAAITSIFPLCFDCCSQPGPQNPRLTCWAASIPAAHLLLADVWHPLPQHCSCH
jgi:hypothetical protein